MTQTAEDAVTSRPRTVALLAAAAAVLAVVVVLAVSRPWEGDAPSGRTPSESLGTTSQALDDFILDFHDHDARWPHSATTDGRAVTLERGSDSVSYSPALFDGVRLVWWRGTDERFAYCLSGRGRYLLAVQTEKRVDKAGFRGACPTASLTPNLSPP